MARADAGLTISELARRAGVSRDTISNAERGEHSLQASTLHKVARALGKAPSELLAEEERLAPKAESSSLEPQLFDGLEDELRYELKVVESGVEYIIGRAEYWKQELERGRTKEYATYIAARNLSALAIDEFSDFNRWIFGEVSRDLNRATDSGAAPELATEYDALIDKFVGHIVPVQHMLLDNADRLAETEAQRDDLARRRKTADAGMKKDQRSA